VNVLKIAQDVARKIGVTPPTALFGSTQPISVRLVSLLEDECRFLRNQRIFPNQKKNHSFMVTSARVKYPLPADFYAAVPGTTYDSQLDRRMIGPLSDPAFNERIYGQGSNSHTGWRIFGPDANPASSGGQFYIDPPPANSTDVYTFDYITKYMFYSDDYATGSETIAADTDVCLFDDDVVLKGVEWRYRESKGQQFETQRAEHASLLNAAVARWAPQYRGTFGSQVDGPRYSVPDGSWSF